MKQRSEDCYATRLAITVVIVALSSCQSSAVVVTIVITKITTQILLLALKESIILRELAIEANVTVP